MTTPKLQAEFNRLYPHKLAGSKAEYDPRHYRFQRQQSQLTALLEWEDVTQLPEPWWRVLLALTGYLLLIYAAYLLLPFFSALVRAV